MHLSPMQSAIVALSLTSILVQIATLRIFSKRNLHKEFPIFFRYTACSAGIGLFGTGIYMIGCECPQYFYIYLASSAVLMCFQFGVMYESFVNALKPYSALIDLGKMIFRWAGVFLLLAALLTGFTAHGAQSNGASNAYNIENVMERILGLMQAGLLLLFFAFERKLGLAWRSYSMAVVLGLGVSAAVTLSTAYIAAHNPAFQPILALVSSLTYLTMVCFWAICFRQVEPARKNVLDSPARLIFQRWNEALLSHGYGQAVAASSVESFLPGIEKTVDRVMARSVH